MLLAAGVATAKAPAPSPLMKDNLYGTKFVDRERGFAVGAFGTILRTTDGGVTWQAQVSTTTQQLYDVDFATPDRGWAVGRSGVILATDDGGQTWTPQTSGTENHLFSVDFADADHGIIAGDWGTILTTKDGGQTWVTRALADDIILNDVSVVDETHAWVVGELGIVMASTDGGATWTKQNAGIDKSLFGVTFIDPLHGWVVGIDALILRTTDGGQTWQVQNGATEVRGLEQVGFGQAYENPSLYTVAVVGDAGIAAGEIGAIYISSDGGTTWQRQNKPDDKETGPKWFRAASLAPGADGAIVGAGGVRVMVVDGQVKKVDGGTRAAEAVH